MSILCDVCELERATDRSTDVMGQVLNTCDACAVLMGDVADAYLPEIDEEEENDEDE